jgi:hypothetical protein
MKLITLICVCGGSQDIPTRDMELHPSAQVRCGYMKTINGEHVTCELKYPVSEIWKAVEAGQSEYDARMKPPSLEFKG